MCAKDAELVNSMIRGMTVEGFAVARRPLTCEEMEGSRVVDETEEFTEPMTLLEQLSTNKTIVFIQIAICFIEDSLECTLR